MLISNDPAASTKTIANALDRQTALHTLRFQERERIRGALNKYLINASIFDFTYADESSIEAIGHVQKANASCPLVCISSRMTAGRFGASRSGMFSYAHPQVPALVLRKLLQRSRSAEATPFQGPLQASSLIEVIQLLLFAGVSGRVMVWNGWSRGELWVHRSQIVHADLSGREGQAAVLALLEWPRGTFRFQAGRPTIQSIQFGLHHPLFDAVAESRDSSAESIPRRLDWLDITAGDDGDAEADVDLETFERAVGRRDEALRSETSSERSPLLGSDIVNHYAPMHIALAVGEPAPLRSTLSPEDTLSSTSSRTSSPAIDLGAVSAISSASASSASPASTISAGCASASSASPASASSASSASAISASSGGYITVSQVAGSSSSAETLGEIHSAADEELLQAVSSYAITSTDSPSGQRYDSEPALDSSFEHSLEQSWRQIDAASFSTDSQEEGTMAVTSSVVKDVLNKLELSVEGYIGAAVADSDSGMCLGSNGGGGIMNMELAAASNTEVVRSKRKAIKTLNLRDEVEDILITLGKQYHLIRPLRTRSNVFIYLAVDRSRANLAMARFALSDAERDLGA